MVRFSKTEVRDNNRHDMDRALNGGSFGNCKQLFAWLCPPRSCSTAVGLDVKAACCASHQPVRTLHENLLIASVHWTNQKVHTHELWLQHDSMFPGKREYLSFVFPPWEHYFPSFPLRALQACFEKDAINMCNVWMTILSWFFICINLGQIHART